MGEISLRLSKPWRLWSVAVILLLFWLLLFACGEEPAPSPSPTTVTPTATATPLPLSVLPTATPATLSTSPIPTTTQTLTQSATITAAEAAGQARLSCAEEADIALIAYPDLQHLMGCAQGQAIFDPIAINEFGPGPDFDRFMLWFGHELQIYVLRPDKSWQVYPDTWTEDQPTFACNPLGGEETSPPLPRRGFGKLWCEQGELQTVMGTVAKEERLCQHTVLQPFAHGRLLACYEDATIRYIRVMDDGSWDQVLMR